MFIICLQGPRPLFSEPLFQNDLGNIAFEVANKNNVMILPLVVLKCYANTIRFDVTRLFLYKHTESYRYC